MKFYIAEVGCYEQRHFGGLFDSPERAMAYHSHAGEHWQRSWWEREGREEWTNGLDWDEYVEISSVELNDSGPLAPPAPAQVLVWASDRGPLNEIPIPHEAAEAIAALWSR